MSKEQELEAKLVCAEPFFDFAKATAFDSEGNEVAIPVCDKCNGGYMTCLMGRSHHVWMCSCGI
jgi:hypothetical protein